ncbi:hypothetical protein MYCTH_94820 [Thermothelomyces thermophilus ATCC 42464]|uniref:Uncharacterized protein n=1 Tax=Thermothelomyces thermophilus (strain ATCC 42464 / BCRC 31852 / DSM 1799) TaxID=573729 RepID=G2QFA5_THET4|nr:uncharacterized protein MYCTH_94820 [Thermothelomyces thermophilus ATCC 42464]AEO59134.1 hypothetical protein MYCTH_94820 [Thermothelomyces thermophilus ATCC 42464]
MAINDVNPVLDILLEAILGVNNVERKDATPFAYPVFVVWRTIKGIAKGRVIINLYSLNKLEIITALYRKKFITVIDYRNSPTLLSRSKNIRVIGYSSSFFYSFTSVQKDITITTFAPIIITIQMVRLTYYDREYSDALDILSQGSSLSD